MSDAPSSEAVESQNTPAVEAPKPQSTHINFDSSLDEQKDVVRARIDANFRQDKESKRTIEDLKKKNAELEAKALELQKPVEVEKPPVELAYTDEAAFNEQNEAYIASQAATANWKAQNELRQQQQAAEIERSNKERLGTFLDRGAKAGIDIQELSMAAAIITPSLPEEVNSYISDHPYGPALAKHLASNPMEVQQLASLNIIEAGVKLTEMAKAFQAKTQSSAPEPDDPLTGSGAPAKDSQYGDLLDGATFS